MMAVDCAGCSRPILDRFLLHFLDKTWHSKCVRCHCCSKQLDEKCFYRDGNIYCREDFYRCFGPKCGGCGEGIFPQDFVRKARDKVYHVRCFTCSVCQKQLSTGEVLYLQPGEDSTTLMCKDDYLKYQQDQLFSDEEEDLDDGVSLPSGVSGDGSTPHPPPVMPGLPGMGQMDAKFEANNNMYQGGGGVPPHPPGMGMPHPPPGSIPPAPGSGVHAGHHHPGMHGGGFPPGGQGLPPPPGSLGSEMLGGLKTATPAGSGGASDHDNDSIDGMDGLDGKLEDHENKSPDGEGGSKRRGPRTTIKAKQLEVLKTAFQQTPKPTRHIREQLAKDTGLSMRVIQVWFQNKRSKERRMKQMTNGMVNARGFFGGKGGRRGFPMIGDDYGYLREPFHDFGGPPGGPGGYPGGPPPGPPGIYPPHHPGDPGFFPGGPPHPGMGFPPPGMMDQPLPMHPGGGGGGPGMDFGGQQQAGPPGSGPPPSGSGPPDFGQNNTPGIDDLQQTTSSLDEDFGHEGTENSDQSKSSPTKDSGGGDGTTGDQSGAGPTGNEDSMNWADLKV